MDNRRFFEMYTSFYTGKNINLINKTKLDNSYTNYLEIYNTLVTVFSKYIIYVSRAGKRLEDYDSIRESLQFNGFELNSICEPGYYFINFKPLGAYYKHKIEYKSVQKVNLLDVEFSYNYKLQYTPKQFLLDILNHNHKNYLGEPSNDIQISFESIDKQWLILEYDYD